MTPPVLSFEFFPPKTEENKDKLRATCAELLPLAPKFVSVTFGAGGATQQGTLETVLEIQKQGVEAAPHLSCVGASREDIRRLLKTYQEKGIHHLVALRGDLPSGMGALGEFHHANELVEFIRAETGDWFYIEVAAYPEIHPQAKTPSSDLENFVRKVQAGANAAITQYFYNADAYFRWMDEVRKKGVDIPIVPGIMPITNYTQLSRFSEMCGAEIPRWIIKRLQEFGDDRDAIRAFGIDVTTALCQKLLEGGAPGLHFYTLNNATASKAICQQLGLS